MAGQAAVGLFGALFVFTVRAGFMAAYDQAMGSYPQEALIYAQGRCGAERPARRQTSLSSRGVRQDVPVVIDQSVTSGRGRGSCATAVPGNGFEEGFSRANAVVFVSTQNQAKMQPYLHTQRRHPYTHMVSRSSTAASNAAISWPTSSRVSSSAHGDVTSSTVRCAARQPRRT
jgi:hypothetical protein